MSRRGRQPRGVVVSFFRLWKSFHLLSLRKQFTERIIHYQVVLPTAPKGVLPKTPKGSGDCPQKVVGTIYRRLNNSPTAPFQRSAVHQATLRRTFDNSPPYFDASRAESRVKQGGEFRHIGRRFSPWTTEILIEQGGVMADVTKGIARTAPLNAWNDGKTAVLRQSPQPPEQARGV